MSGAVVVVASGLCSSDLPVPLELKSTEVVLTSFPDGQDGWQSIGLTQVFDLSSFSLFANPVAQ